MNKIRKQVKVYVGERTLQKWDAIRHGFTSNSAAFAAIVESYYATHAEVTAEVTREEGYEKD